MVFWEWLPNTNLKGFAIPKLGKRSYVNLQKIGKWVEEDYIPWIMELPLHLAGDKITSEPKRRRLDFPPPGIGWYDDLPSIPSGLPSTDEIDFPESDPYTPQPDGMDVDEDFIFTHRKIPQEHRIYSRNLIDHSGTFFKGRPPTTITSMILLNENS